MCELHKVTPPIIRGGLLLPMRTATTVITSLILTNASMLKTQVAPIQSLLPIKEHWLVETRHLVLLLLELNNLLKVRIMFMKMVFGLQNILIYQLQIGRASCRERV